MYVEEIELNLTELEAILSRLDAGGPGSGCHGDNCGRPAGSAAITDTLKRAGDAIDPWYKQQFAVKEQDEHFMQLGFTKPELDEFRERLDGHARDATQQQADIDIEENFGTDSRFGQFLKARAEAEEYLLSRYVDKADDWYKEREAKIEKEFLEHKQMGLYNPEYDEPQRYKEDRLGLWEDRKTRDDAKDPVFFRRGGLGKAVLSTTRNSGGAKTAHLGDVQLRIKPTHAFRLSELKKAGYMPVAGFSDGYGYGGENEVLFLRKPDIKAGGPGSGCHGPNCGRPPGPGEVKPAGTTTGGLMKNFGWIKVKPAEGSTPKMVKGHPATTYFHPTHGVMHVTKNWYEHYSPTGTKLGEKTELGKGKPLADKLKAYLKEKTPRGGKPTVSTPTPKPESPKPPEKPIPQPKPEPEKISKEAYPVKNFDHEYKFVKEGSSLGGAHDKYIFERTATGAKFMFKPAQTLDGQPAPMMARAEELASKISSRIGHDTIRAWTTELTVPGQGKMMGSLHQMITVDPQSKDFTNKEVTKLNTGEVKAIQKEQVIDWLISNHDSHPGQFLKSEYGRVYGIDKAQAFKYFGKDQLSTDYHPNAAYGERPPIYNDLFKAVEKGQVHADPDTVLPTIKSIENIPNVQYREWLKPYAAERFGSDAAAANQFLDKAVERKQNIREDFEKFYGKVLKKDDFEFEPKSAKPVDIANALQPKVVHAPETSEAINVAVGLLDKYPQHSKELSSFDHWKISAWEDKIHAGQSKVQAAKGLGLYPELAAAMDLNPGDVKKAQSLVRGWTGSSTSDDGLKIQQYGQEIVNGKCCTTSEGKAMMLEYAATQAKLRQTNSDGIITVFRGVRGDHAISLMNAAEKGEYVGIKTRGAESWSTSKKEARKFTEGYYDSVILTHEALPIEHVITSYKTNQPAFLSFQDEEEYVVSFPQQKQVLPSRAIKTIVKSGKKISGSAFPDEVYNALAEIEANLDAAQKALDVV